MDSGTRTTTTLAYHSESHNCESNFEMIGQPCTNPDTGAVESSCPVSQDQAASLCTNDPSSDAALVGGAFSYSWTTAQCREAKIWVWITEGVVVVGVIAGCLVLVTAATGAGVGVAIIGYMVAASSIAGGAEVGLAEGFNVCS
jgi:hypothetical protein